MQPLRTTLSAGVAFLISASAMPAGVSAQNPPGATTLDPPFTLVGEWPTGEWPGWIEVDGNRAVLVGEDSLHILDVSDPASPRSISRSLHGVPNVEAVAVAGETLVVGGWPDCLITFDISDTAGPVFISNARVPWCADCGYSPFLIADSTAFVGAPGVGLMLLDLSDPASPERQGHYSPPSGNPARAVGVLDDLAYASFIQPDGYYLHVVDVSDPAAPVPVAEDSTLGVIYDMRISRPWLYVLGEGELMILDLTDPRLPTKRGSVGVPMALSVVVQDTLAFVAAGSNGLRVVDASDPDHPTEVAYLILSEWIREVDVEGDLLYLVGSDGLYIVRFDLTSVGVDEQVAGVQPRAVTLDSVYPNPFKGTATVSYSLPLLSRVRVSVFDLLGREVTRMLDGVQPAGTHEVTLDGSGLRSGVYLLQVEAGGASQARTVVLLR